MTPAIWWYRDSDTTGWKLDEWPACPCGAGPSHGYLYDGDKTYTYAIRRHRRPISDHWEYICMKCFEAKRLLWAMSA